MPIKGDKGAVRAHYTRLRDGLKKAERENHSKTLVENLFRLPLLQEASHILFYAAKGGEMDILPLVARLEREGIACYLPVTREEGLIAARYDGKMALESRVLGIREPKDILPIDPARLDVILTPGVAFDDRGGRLGHGGGYYDRLFQRTDALRVGLCHEVQVADFIPMDEWDVRMDITLTEEGVLYAGDRIHRFHFESPML